MIHKLQGAFEIVQKKINNKFKSTPGGSQYVGHISYKVFQAKLLNLNFAAFAFVLIIAGSPM
jgi:hypothetical protein